MNSTYSRFPHLASNSEVEKGASTAAHEWDCESLSEAAEGLLTNCVVDKIDLRRPPHLVASFILEWPKARCPLLMLWTAPPPGRECHECGSC